MRGKDSTRIRMSRRSGCVVEKIGKAVKVKGSRKEFVRESKRKVED